jgi:hypothetical protein
VWEEDDFATDVVTDNQELQELLGLGEENDDMVLLEEEDVTLAFWRIVKIRRSSALVCPPNHTPRASRE